MRLSTLEHDRGFHAKASKCKVFVDGERVHHVAILDTERGLCLCIDRKNKKSEVKEGDITIEYPKGFNIKN